MDEPSPPSLSDDQRARLRARLARKGQTSSVITRRAEDATRLPLSFAQEPLWFLTRLSDDGRAGYAITLAMTLDGPLDVPALRAGLQLVVERHEALRTVFGSEGADVWQVVLPPAPFDLPVEDLSVQGDGAETRAVAVRREEAGRPFDLARGPLFRARLLRFAPDRHELVIGVHHIVADGWSIGVLARELATAYDALVREATPALPALPVQYGDYALWQRRTMSGDALERQLAYWRERLAGSRPLELPLDFARPSRPIVKGASERAVLSPELSSGVRRVAKDTRSTLFMTLLAAYQVALMRATGERDVVVGTPVANRTMAEVEPLIGFFVNSVVLRTTIDPEMTLAALVGRVRDVCLGAFDHQGTPFERLVDALCTERDASRNPLFQVAFNVLDGSGATLEGGGLRFGALRGLSEATRFDLEAHVTDLGHGLVIDFLYQTGLFEAGTVARLLRQMVRVVETLVHAPDTRVVDVPLMDAAERAALVAGSRGAAGPDPVGPSLGQRLLAVAAAHPDAVAVEDGATRVTYAALATQARALAGGLRALGVGPNVVVGVWQARGADLWTTVAGIAVAGGAYLPVEPHQPAARAAQVLAAAGTRVVVTTAALLHEVPAGPWQVVLAEDLAGPGPPVSEAPGTSADLAYVLFTSGSTGTPKGVAVPQAGVVRLVVGTDYVTLGPSSVIGQAATAAFDAATFEVWGAWLHGARLVVLPPAVAVAPAALGAYLQRTGVTTLFLTTALVHQIGRETPGALAGLDTLLFGGEAVEPKWVAAIQTAGGPRRILHVYGPTEHTTFSTWGLVGPVPAGATTLSIGGPIAQSTCWVEDAAGTLAAVGVPGELLVGGPGLAWGYLGNPRLTAERFVPDRHSGAVGARLYRTGDIVRWTAPGQLRFVGRRDGQVKLRGFRIELGEVEAALRAVPGVGAAVVVVRGTGLDRQLVGYVEPTPDRATSGAAVSATAPAVSSRLLSPADVRRALHATLPAYMVPAAVVVLPALPLNANGKVDRRALPAPGTPETGSAVPAAPPRSAIEQQIAAVWRDVLGLDAVGIDDSFFDLGGHSLLLVRVQAGLEAALAQPVPLVTLFQYPTISALAAHLRGDEVSTGHAAHTGEASRVAHDEPVAVIGYAGRFPGAPTVEALWDAVRDGRELLHRFSAEELTAAGVPGTLQQDARYVPVRGVIADPDLFDAALFGLSPREAALLDPQQRVLLECAWTALEHAGYGPQTRRPERIGVWAGTSANTYVARADRRALTDAGALQVLVSSDKDFLATRVGYKLDLGGPAVTVQTACSTSLVAVHLASQALRAGECEVALAGGVSITVPAAGYVYQPEGIASPDGHCRPFDAAAAGTVAGNGVGVVVLKPLARARADGDTIHAVLTGSAINNDGADKVGFTAPSVHGQAAVVRAAQAAAGLTPAQIGYVESHGTGTALGDPIEVAALRQVWGDAPGPVGLSSVKGSVGHLDAAAGVTGLLTAIQAVRTGEIPATAHFTRPNPQLDLGPFTVANAPRPWPTAGVRRAGVSSFGMGGTNAHVVVEQAPEDATAMASRRAAAHDGGAGRAGAVAGASDPTDVAAFVTESTAGALGAWQVVPVSGQSAEAVAAAATQLADWLEHHGPGHESVEGSSAVPPSDVTLADVAWTQQVGRAALPVRRVAVGRAAATVAAALRTAPDHVVRTTPPVVWMCLGQGTALRHAGAALYRQPASAFRAELDACAHALHPLLGVDLRAVLYPEPEQTAWATSQLATTLWTQVGLVAVGLALAAQWRAWGVRPAAVVGHSVGEITAAALAGVLTRADALRLAAARGQAMGAAPSGGMLAVLADEATTRTLLGDDLWLAAVNGPTQCVVAGAEAALVRAEAACAARGLATQRLATAGAFHSGLMAGAVAPIAAAAAALPHQAPAITWVSSVTAEVMADPSAPYWSEQVLSPVRWADAAAAVSARVGGPAVWMELGPGHTLSHLVRGAIDGATTVPSLDGPAADETMARAIGALWTAGVPLDWAALHAPGRPRRRPLPTYPFQRQRYWLVGARPADDDAGTDAPLAKRASIDDWIHQPCWRQTPHVRAASGATGATHVMLAGDAGPLRDALADELRRRGRQVAIVEGAAPSADLMREHLRAGDGAFDVVFVTGSTDAWRAPTDAFVAVVRLLQQLDGLPLTAPRVTVVTERMQKVRGDEPVEPGLATLRGLAAAARLEMPRLRLRLVDVEPDTSRDPRAVGRLADECQADDTPSEIAHRGSRRWVRSFEHVPPGARRPLPLTRGATCLITGGTGRVGLALARFLVDEADARVILASRHASARAAAVEAAGIPADRMRLVDVDVTDAPALAAALRETERDLGPVRGVVHAAAATDASTFVDIAALDAPTCQRQFAPKIAGTLAIAEVLGRRPLDFCVLMSSISAHIGGLGFAAYAAANAFLDAFAEAHAGSDLPWISVAWDGWRFGEESGAAGDASRLAMTPAEGVEVFARTVLLGPGVWVVSTAPLDHRLARLVRGAAAPAESSPAPQAPRPALSSAYRPPETETEMAVAAAWRSALGIAAVGLDDNFIELGGHSLLGVQLTGALSTQLGIRLGLRDLWDRATVGELAAFIDVQRAARHESGGAAIEDRVAATLASIQDLSEEEIERLLSE